MRTFTCSCGNRLYFENSLCLNCGHLIGFDPASLTLSDYQAQTDGTWLALAPVILNRPFRRCQNGIDFETCNWMVAQTCEQNYCLSCAMNEVIPDLDLVRRRELWLKVERAKRRLLYTLLVLKLALRSKRQDPNTGLAFRILSDERLDADSIDAETHNLVTTGHYFGCITLNLLEADDSMREQMRKRMNERYRTLLGHFRHESGHYYWFLLIDKSRWLTPFRKLFGDERQDYAAALNNNRVTPPDNASRDWRENYISRYASIHPWEDFGETWAHYMHMVDTLETARDANFEIEGQRLRSPFNEHNEFTTLLHDWLLLSSALNRLNRSMGLKDAYPFVLSQQVIEKLAFVHRVIREHCSDRI